MRVYFDVTGNGYQEALGALTISVYESKDNATWTCVQTYNHDQYSQMMAYNEFYHSGYVEYDGVVGRYYKAYVGIWGGGMEVGDSRYFYTSAKKATSTIVRIFFQFTGFLGAGSLSFTHR